MSKRYHIQYNIGKVKYLVNYHNGISKHSDGSDFYDIATFTNKVKLNTFITSLKCKGFYDEKCSMITLYASRKGTSVEIHDEKGKLKAIFPNTGYRPTKATKEITLNCFRYKLEWK